MGRPADELGFDKYLKENQDIADANAKIGDNPALDKLINNCVEAIERDRETLEMEIRHLMKRVIQCQSQGLVSVVEAEQIKLGDLRAKYQNIYGNLPNDIR